MRVSIVSIFCALALLGTAQAANTAAKTTSPTIQDMAKWKSEVLSKYDDITYLDEDSKTIKEDVFFSRVAIEKRGFNMQTDSAAPKRITIRLLSDVEQRLSQAPTK
jgi:hypothetical protein